MRLPPFGMEGADTAGLFSVLVHALGSTGGPIFL